MTVIFSVKLIQQDQIPARCGGLVVVNAALWKSIVEQLYESKPE